MLDRVVRNDHLHALVLEDAQVIPVPDDLRVPLGIDVEVDPPLLPIERPLSTTHVELGASWYGLGTNYLVVVALHIRCIRCPHVRLRPQRHLGNKRWYVIPHSIECRVVIPP